MKYTLLFIAAASLFAAEESSRTIAKSFPLSGNARRVRVCGMNGSIRVTAAAINEVRFSIEEKLSASTRERLEELKKESDVVFAQEAGMVRAAVKGPWSSGECGEGGNRRSRQERNKWDWKDNKVEHQFTVTVPADAQLELQSVNGSLHVTGTAGRYWLQTVNGSIHMTDVEGAGDVATVNGTVQAVYRKNPGADTKFRTVNGKLDLYFQPALSADFEVKTVNGKAYTDFEMAAVASAREPETQGMKVIHRRGSSGQLRAGTGGPKIITETVNGSILIHSLEKGRP
jgi:hypothetical protein